MESLNFEKMDEIKTDIQLNIEKQLLKWINNLYCTSDSNCTSDKNISILIKYLETERQFIEKSNSKELLVWIDDTIKKIRIKDFYNLKIDIERRIDNEIMRYLYFRHVSPDKIKMIMLFIKGQ